MCEICEKKMSVAFMMLKSRGLGAETEAAQKNYLVACSNNNTSSASRCRIELHRLLDEVLDLHEKIVTINQEIATDIINSLYGSDEDASIHVQSFTEKIH